MYNKEKLFNGNKEGNPASGMVEDLEGIMLNEVSDRKTSNTWSHLPIKPENLNSEKQRTDQKLPEVGNWEKKTMDEGGQQIQTTSYKISKF